MKRYICLHGHFYQPPRENPWLEAIEAQDSAYPYHDWNERITAECYAPNTRARILDGTGHIERIINNYTRISNNFGPTLLTWLQNKKPEIYEAILQADRESLERFGGHGSAVAQAYNHIIMPLANRRDKVTQVRWGIEDFRERFGRDPEGMWLAETAVDLETLEVLADEGIKYTILSPYQASRVKFAGEKKWQDVVGGRVDPTTPYRQKLSGHKSIAIFFYDGPISQGIAFEKLLVRGEDFAHRLMGAFNDERDWDQIVHIATDGETYGHHHKHGEMALAYALEYIEKRDDVELVNYGKYLADHPELPQVEITERTAWSCVHGVERWNSDCGCNSGGHDGWNQAWRRPLRAALDWLRDRLEEPFEREAKTLFTDPWTARDAYISVILNRTSDRVDHFLNKFTKKLPEGSERTRALKLMELQRHLMLMYTSCGWFFDELSGIETVQVIEYAGYAVQLAQDLFDDDSIEAGFTELLAEAHSNIPEYGTGRDLYNRWVKPTRVDLEKVAAHYAANSLFEDYGDDETARVYCYNVVRRKREQRQAGTARFLVECCDITSDITKETCTVLFAVLHLGDHNVIGGVMVRSEEQAVSCEGYAELKQSLLPHFERADFPTTITALNEVFGGRTFSLGTLFRDEQRNIVAALLEKAESRVEAAYRQIFEQQLPLAKFLSSIGTPMTPHFRNTAEVIINLDLKRAFQEETLDQNRIENLLVAAEDCQITLDIAGLSFALQHRIEGLIAEIHPTEPDELLIDRAERALDLAEKMPFPVTLAEAQNMFFAALRNRGLIGTRIPEGGIADSTPWHDRLQGLAEKLSFRLPTPA